MSDLDYFDPDHSRELAYLVLSNRDRHPLDAAETAYIFGCDLDLLGQAQAEHVEQSAVWTASALDARADGDADEAQACLHEARVWASNANALRDAADLCRMRIPAPPTWSLGDHVDRYHEASARRSHQFHVVRERLGLVGEDPECCADECCRDECCGGAECVCGGCTIGYIECRVCGQWWPTRPTPPDLDLSAAAADSEVLAAEQQQELRLAELYAAFDAAVAQWRRDAGI